MPTPEQAAVAALANPYADIDALLEKVDAEAWSQYRTEGWGGSHTSLKCGILMGHLRILAGMYRVALADNARLEAELQRRDELLIHDAALKMADMVMEEKS